MSDDVWISRRNYTENERGERESHPVSVTREIAEKREDLAGEEQSTTSFVLPTVRGLVIASVLEECAARARRSGGGGDAEIAALCDDLVKDLLQRAAMTS